MKLASNSPVSSSALASPLNSAMSEPIRGCRYSVAIQVPPLSIDFALFVVAEWLGQETAEQIQLNLEYDPAPPFPGGSPKSARSEQLAAAHAASAKFRDKRRAATLRTAARRATVSTTSVK